MTRRGPSGDATRASRASGTAAPPGRPARSRRGSAKFRPPTMRVELVERRSLIAALSGAAEPLVLLCAPAGTGKTTTLALWAAADERPVVWLQLEKADDDPVVLLLQLVRALGVVMAIDPAAEASLALPVPPVRERVLPLLDEALAEATPFLLVLDDAHLLAGGKCWDVVAFVLRGLPPGAQLALGTRAEPPLALARMRTAGEVAEFRAADLAFDREEAEHLLRAHACGPIDAATLDALFEVTEGWAAGLRLACRASRDAGQGQWAATGPRRQARDRRLPHRGGDRPPATGRAGVPAARLGAARAHPCPVPIRLGTRRRGGAPRGGGSRRAVHRPGRRGRTPLPLPPPLRGGAWRGARASPSGRGCGPASQGRRLVRPARGSGCHHPPPAVGGRRRRRRRCRRGVLAAGVDPRPGRDRAPLARVVQRPADPRAPGAHAHGRVGVHGARRRGARSAMGQGRLQRTDDRRAVTGRRRLAALVAGAPARHHRPRRRAPHARGRRACGGARDERGLQLVRRRTGGARRGALALGLRAGAHGTRSPSASARVRCTTRPRSWLLSAIWR